MSEQQDVIEDLSGVNALTSFRWAYGSAVAKALEDYSEEDGHDATFFGVSRYTLFRDRTDRVFHCGRFAVPSGDADADLDQLLAGLSETDINLMPRIPAGVAIRAVCTCWSRPGVSTSGARPILASIQMVRSWIDPFTPPAAGTR